MPCAPSFAPLREGVGEEDDEDEDEEEGLGWCVLANGTKSGSLRLRWEAVPDCEAELLGHVDTHIAFTVEQAELGPGTLPASVLDSRVSQQNWSLVYSGPESGVVVAIDGIGLAFLTTYGFRVSVQTSAGSSPWSKALVATTPAWRPGGVQCRCGVRPPPTPRPNTRSVCLSISARTDTYACWRIGPGEKRSRRPRH